MTGNPNALELILAELSDLLVSPSDDMPSVRCVSTPCLVGLVRKLAASLDIPAGKVPSGTQAINLLSSLKLIRSIPLDDVAHGVGKNRFLAVGLGVDPSTIHPLELLQTHVPTGVVCYMSALGVHDLTTQPTAHHHIARLETAPTRVLVPPSEAGSPGLTKADGRMRTVADQSLGQWQFTFQGLRYYLTQRDRRFLPAHQVRSLSDKSRYTVTTLEQTLLDTLHRPASCGGPTVVFEAWESATERLDVEKMKSLLKLVGDDRLNRRAGYMLERVGFEVAHVQGAVESVAIPLLPGMPYSTFDARWNITVP